MKAKKSYGQHFLKEEGIAAKIADSLELRHTYSDLVEVGPGMGMLTKYLLNYKENQPRVLVSEADKDMVAYLKVHYPQLTPNILEGDFLKVDLKPHLPGQFGLIGNFPYNISSQILFRMLEYKEQIPEMVGMFQLEVARRIASAPNSKEYGVISVLLQAFYTAKVLFQVKPGCFNPPPKVQSAVIRMERRPSMDIGCDYKLFRSVVKQTFGQRRKMMRNTLLSLLPKEILHADELFTRRPETLSVAEFVTLTNRVAAYRAELKANGQLDDNDDNIIENDDNNDDLGDDLGDDND
jgi:16S rRNA (adenine1518-N6/adenine1519-N6)-dimethyltransferase